MSTQSCARLDAQANYKMAKAVYVAYIERKVEAYREAAKSDSDSSGLITDSSRDKDVAEWIYTAAERAPDLESLKSRVNNASYMITVGPELLKIAEDVYNDIWNTRHRLPPEITGRYKAGDTVRMEWYERGEVVDVLYDERMKENVCKVDYVSYLTKPYDRQTHWLPERSLSFRPKEAKQSRQSEMRIKVGSLRTRPFGPLYTASGNTDKSEEESPKGDAETSEKSHYKYCGKAFTNMENPFGDHQLCVFRAQSSGPDNRSKSDSEIAYPQQRGAGVIFITFSGHRRGKPSPNKAETRITFDSSFVCTSDEEEDMPKRRKEDRKERRAKKRRRRQGDSGQEVYPNDVEDEDEVGQYGADQEAVGQDGADQEAVGQDGADQDAVGQDGAHADPDEVGQVGPDEDGAEPNEVDNILSTLL